MIRTHLAERPKELPDLDALFADVGAFLARRERIVLIVDARHANPDAARRRRTAQWFEDNADVVKRYLLGCGVVAPTPFHRGIIVALKWLHTPAIPFEVFGGLPEATSWAEGLAARSGLRVPKAQR